MTAWTRERACTHGEDANTRTRGHSGERTPQERLFLARDGPRAGEEGQTADRGALRVRSAVAEETAQALADRRGHGQHTNHFSKWRFSETPVSVDQAGRHAQSPVPPVASGGGAGGTRT